MRKKHDDMIRELSKYISPELRHEWDLFRNGLTSYLTRRVIYGSGLTFVGDHCEILFRQGIIKLGDYSVLLEVVNSIDERAGDIVKRATTAIKDIKTRISNLKPKEGQLEVGGGERSTIYQSQLAEEIQRLEIDIRKKHADMIRELNGCISPQLPNEWNLFRNGLTPYLTNLEIYGECVTFVGNHCESLLSKNIIKLGDYSVLLEVVNSIDERVGDIVKRATTAIKDIKTRISDLKPKARSDHITSSAYKKEDPFFENTEESSTFLKASTSPRERIIDVGKRENMIRLLYCDHNEIV
ncbi:uncharacterized protein LOC110460698 [Mizuhopecten yessoensis]|uniref:uncharacterized protein LOC110460698 n=1 Tax=Mizuhopecten yessoensis TaxID=6573 RepID=UPI000B45E62B|nr:uncharacterized protein LOC110460698 [Mizuhopecten yessoensis]